MIARAIRFGISAPPQLWDWIPPALMPSNPAAFNNQVKKWQTRSRMSSKPTVLPRQSRHRCRDIAGVEALKSVGLDVTLDGDAALTCAPVLRGAYDEIE